MTTETTQTLQQFLTQPVTGPYVAIYLNHEPDAGRDKVRLELRHSIAHAQQVMATTWPETDWSAYGERLDRFQQDPTELLAMPGAAWGILANDTGAYVRALEYPVESAAMVTATPQLLPMILDAQRHLEFDLLALNADNISLYHNDGEELTPISLPDTAPLTLIGTLGSEKRGGSVNTIGQGKGKVSYHGHGDKSSEAEVDARRYYQAVDDYIMTHISNPHDRRLVLFGLPQNIALFREISRNPHLSGTMQIDMSPNNLTLAELDAAVDMLREHNGSRVHGRILATIDAARSGGRYRTGLGDIITAALDGAIDRLIIRQGARINGRLLADGRIDTTTARAQHNNLITDIADATLARGGKVRVLPEEDLDLPVVATLRYRVD